MAHRILFISFIIIFGSYNAQSQTNQITSSENEPASLIERALPDNSSYLAGYQATTSEEFPINLMKKVKLKRTP